MARLYTFYLIVITQTLSLIGSRMTSIGIGIWLFNTSGNTAPLLLMAFFNELPGMLGSSLAGVFVDRWPRRQVLILADLGQAVGSLLLMLSFLSGQFQLWHLYLIVLLQGIFAIFQHPAQEATITMLVPEQHRERANAIQQMAFPLAGVVAPVLAGLVYVAAGIAGVIALDLATFLVAVVVIYLIHIPEPQQSAEGQASQGNFWREMRGGFQYLRQRPALLSLLLYSTLINFLLNGPLELAIPYMILVTGSETQMGWLMGVASLGAFSGAALIAMWGGSRPRIHTLLPSLLLTGVMFLVYGTARTPLLLGASIFLLMLPLPMSNALFISIMQVKTPPDMQGRIFSIIAQLGFVGATTSFLLTGPLVDRVLEPAVGEPLWQWVEPVVGNQPGAGIGLLLVVVGLIILTSTTLMYALPRIRRLELTLPDYEAVAVNL
jgi:MFS family permease